ncbi:MAG TPA: PH domain-containing protein [Anaerolineales bacterium]|jgi:uncharacterized membrane protein YdbT with pleckstrin-like domain
MTMYRPAIRWWSLRDTKLIAHFNESLEVLEDRLVLRKGTFSKTETVIPFDRITNYNVSQSFFDRIFNICHFRIETAGSIAPELHLAGYPESLKDVLSNAVDFTG